MVIWIFICSPAGGCSAARRVARCAVARPALLGDVAEGRAPVSPKRPVPSQPARVSPRTIDSAAPTVVRAAVTASPRLSGGPSGTAQGRAVPGRRGGALEGLGRRQRVSRTLV